MNLTEIYINVFFENFFKELQEEYLLNEESDPALQGLLTKANKLVFEKFGIYLIIKTKYSIFKNLKYYSLD